MAVYMPTLTFDGAVHIPPAGERHYAPDGRSIDFRCGAGVVGYDDAGQATASRLSSSICLS